MIYVCWVKDVRHKNPRYMIQLMWNVQHGEVYRDRKHISDCLVLEEAGGEVEESDG